MTGNQDEQSRLDIQAKIDRILREPEPEIRISPERKPDPISIPQPLAGSVEAQSTNKTPSPKKLSIALTTFTGSIGKLQKAIAARVRSLGKPKKDSGDEKSQPKVVAPQAQAKKVGRSRPSKKLTFVVGGLSLAIVIGLTAFLNLSYMTVSAGIETNLGTSENRTLFTIRASDAEQGDLIVAALSMNSETNEELLVVGTVFSKNEQSYALYDGEVIWQISADQIRGKVLFAEATESP